MKANPYLSRGCAARLWRRWPLALAGLGMLLLAGCAAPLVVAPVVAPVASAPPVYAPAGASLSAGPVLDWRDAPLSAGAWEWGMRAAGSTARFDAGGGAGFEVACPRGGGVVVMTALVAGGGVGDALVSLTTSTMERQFSARAVAGGYAFSLGAGDRLVDALAFTRGRFALDILGAPRLILPADPAISRVVEDCRAGR